jgi:hypothetical protein
MKQALLLTLSLALGAPTVNADSWRYEKRSTDKVYEYGETKIILTVDATRNQLYPDFIVKVFKNGELMAQYRNVAFEHLAALRDASLFIGVSNDGLPGTAIVIFDKNGNLQLELKHDMAHFDYCSHSVTRVREWYSREKPDFSFDETTKEVRFRDCHEKLVSLKDVLDKVFGVHK